MKLITRTVIESTITAKKFSYENEHANLEDVEPVVIVSTAKVTEAKATKILINERGPASYVAISISTKETVYGIDFETFMANAKVITRPASQQKGK